MGKKIRSGHIQYGLMIVPAFIGYAVIFMLPVAETFLYSFTNWNSYHKEISFVFFQNYLDLLKDPLIVKSLWNTLEFAVLYTVFQNIIALAIALALDRKMKGQGVFRAAFFIPAVLSTIVVGYLFGQIFSPLDTGFLNRILLAVGLPKMNFLGDSHLAMIAVVISQVWQWIGWAMMIYIANLQSIPADLYEAASIDGAGEWALIRRIKLPLMAPSLTINLFVSMIGGLKIYDIVYAMTSGGPNNATRTVLMTMTMRGMSEGRMGYASAFSVVYFLVILVFSAAQLALTRKLDVTK